jgi:hypothetical protein
MSIVMRSNIRARFTEVISSTSSMLSFGADDPDRTEGRASGPATRRAACDVGTDRFAADVTAEAENSIRGSWRFVWSSGSVEWVAIRREAPLPRS